MRQINNLKQKTPGVTLLELIIAIGLLAIISLAVSNMDLFSRHHLLTTERRSKVMNELSYVLEHMNKQIVAAIGNRAVAGGPRDPVRFTNIGGNRAMEIFVDSSQDGQGDPASPTGSDHWIAYRFNGNQVQFYSRCNAPFCAAGSIGPTTITTGNNVISPAAGDLTVNGNVVNVVLTGIWNPAVTNNTVDNPQVIMRTGIAMPSVSYN